MRRYVTKLYDRLDRITYDAYGTLQGDLVLTVIAANPGLEEQPIVLPPGLVIELPDIATADPAVTTIKQIQLWD